MTLVHAMGQLRVSAEGERYGLDLHEHGITAYPEYVLSAMGQPGGMRGEGGSQPTMPPAPQVRVRAITM
jgi:hypothetical protein